MSHEDVLWSFAWIALVAALAPLLAGLLPGPRIPEVVLLLGLGIVIGPFGFELATESEPISLLNELGLAMLFLIAGIEIEPAILRTRDGTRAVVAWLVSLTVALAWVGALSLALGFEAWHAIAIALTSTALGTLLPILRDTGLRDGPLGTLVMANGAIGEFGPIVAMSLLLTTGRSAGAALVSLVVFGLLALLLGFLVVRHGPRAERIVELVRHHEETTSQAPIRLVVLLLALMLVMSEAFGLDIILGAFIAGVIVRQLLPQDPERFLMRLDGIGFGLLIPVFFVTSGMAIDFGAVIEDWPIAAAFFVSILLVRGLPVLVAFRHRSRLQVVQLSLFSCTGLPIIVAVTTIAVDAGLMHQEGQSVVVAAGMLTVLVFPLTAIELGRRRPVPA
jgi:Kef-type K+ transport system membrane component KefB